MSLQDKELLKDSSARGLGILYTRYISKNNHDDFTDSLFLINDYEL